MSSTQPTNTRKAKFSISSDSESQFDENDDEDKDRIASLPPPPTAPIIPSINIVADSSFATSLLNNQSSTSQYQPQTPTKPPTQLENTLVWDRVRLSPFTNQVGGHKAFLRLTDNTVCKPLQVYEVRFYESMPVDLRPFVPVFLGTIHRSKGTLRYQGVYGGIVEKLVRLDSSVHSFPGRVNNNNSIGGASSNNSSTTGNTDFDKSKRNLSLSDLFSRSLQLQQQQYQQQQQTGVLSPRQALASVATKTVPTPIAEEVFRMDEEQRDRSPTRPPKPQTISGSTAADETISIQPVTSTSSSTPVTIPRTTSQNQGDEPAEDSPKDNTPGATLYINPWSLHQQSSASRSSTETEEYILLEDLTAYLKHPCILDLKMGTRQHGVNIPESKRQSQLKKVQQSTSASLGVRLCGMQLYRKSTNKYYFQDKYYGRKIKSKRELLESLRLFLPRNMLRKIEVLLARLKKLLRVIRHLDGYRFFASSLLLVYDGADDQSVETTETREETTSPPPPNPDDYENDNDEEVVSSAASSNSKSPAAVSAGEECEDNTSIDEEEGGIIVKMVDFANCRTRSDLQDLIRNEYKLSKNGNASEEYERRLLEKEGELFEGNDAGYVKGLETLIELFSELRDEYKRPLTIANISRIDESTELDTLGPLTPPHIHSETTTFTELQEPSGKAAFTQEIDALTSIKFARARQSFNHSPADNSSGNVGSSSSN